MGVIFKSLGCVVVLIGALLGLLALALFFGDDTTAGGVILGILALIMFAIGGRWLLSGSRRPRTASPFQNRPHQSTGNPPTAKQLQYAERLSLNVPPGADHETVGLMLESAELANPELRKQREKITGKKTPKKYDPELLHQERQWEALADQNKWLAAVYQSGQSVKAEVMRINGAFITDSGKLCVEVEVGKLVNDRQIGETFVEVGRYMEFDPSKLLWSQIVDDFEIDDVRRFQATLAETEKQAKKLAR